MRILILSFMLLGLFLISFVPIEAIDIADPDLIAYWPFNEGQGGTAKDVSGNAHDGKLNGEPVWVDGKFEKALEFNTGEDYFEVESVPDFGLEQVSVTY